MLAFFTLPILAVAGNIMQTPMSTDRDQNATSIASLSSLSMHDLLKAADHETIHGASAQVWWAEYGEERKPTTLFKDPATESDIAELEERLGLILPDDYKEFLQASNGFGHGEVDDGMHGGFGPEPELLATQKVHWDAAEYFATLPIELLSLSYEISELVFDTPRRDANRKWIGELEYPMPLFGPVLSIGSRDIVNLWLVTPELMEKARKRYGEMYARANAEQRRVIDEEIVKFAGSRDEFEKLTWCTVQWMAGGAAQLTAWKSFRDYIEDNVKSAKESTYGLDGE